MVLMSVLANALRTIYNAEKRGKRQVLIRPVSKVVIKFLEVMQQKKYIGAFEIIDDHRSGKIVVELLGRINKCSVVSPRFDVQITEIDKWQTALLPSRQVSYWCMISLAALVFSCSCCDVQFGHVVLTTSMGIMDHHEARRKHTGGKVLGFFF
ncbi:RPS15A [Symbiodinium sp. KB8]|nr:RPS15A [Symbiodinium sp. KB8]